MRARPDDLIKVARRILRDNIETEICDRPKIVRVIAEVDPIWLGAQ